jgi:hypothetical protein
MPMNKTIELGLTLMVIGAALAFGGVQPIPYSLMQVGVLLIPVAPAFQPVAKWKRRIAPFTLAAALSSRRCDATGSASGVADNGGGARLIVETSGSVKIWSPISCS